MALDLKKWRLVVKEDFQNIEPDVSLVTSFYLFTAIDDPAKTQALLVNGLVKWPSLQGTILVANEGLNGMIAGTPEEIGSFQNWLKGGDGSLAPWGLSSLLFKDTVAEATPFRRLRVKVKPEIITMRRPITPICHNVGEYIDPMDLQQWFEEGRDFILLDTRNNYEAELGTFEGALNPNVESFGELPSWIEEHFGHHRTQTLVTFCTGGIRCEKLTAFMKSIGFKDVRQLHGGILAYLMAMKQQGEGRRNFWTGECIVFDKRLAVNANLETTQQALCYVCLRLIKDFGSAGPVGERCQSCAHTMDAAAAERNVRGLKRQQEFRSERRDLLKRGRVVDKGIPTVADPVVPTH